MFGPLGQGDIVPVFIKVWVRREHELTQARGTRNTNSARRHRCSVCRVSRLETSLFQNHVEGEEMPQTVSTAEAGTV